MKNSFAELGQNIFSRRFGGCTVGSADPYISGYFFIWFDRLPKQLGSLVSANSNSGISDNEDCSQIKNILAATCTGVTPPGGTLNKIEFPGLGGTKWSVPGNIDYGTTVSLKFIEFRKTPLLSIMHNWVKLMRDYRIGTQTLEAESENSSPDKFSYSGILYYWTTSPDGKWPEYYVCYDGVFPTKDPQDLYAGDIENVARLDVEIEFNVDYMYHEPWVYDKVMSFYENFFSTSKDIVLSYGEKNS